MNRINNINRRKFLVLIGGCSCGLILPSCTTVPITDRKQISIFPESYINRQAFQLYENVKKKTKLSTDKKKLDEIKEIGTNIEEAVSSYFVSINKKHPTYKTPLIHLIVLIYSNIKHLSSDFFNSTFNNRNANNIYRISKIS